MLSDHALNHESYIQGYNQGVRWFPIFYNRKKIPSVVHFAWIVTVVTDNGDKIGLS